MSGIREYWKRSGGLFMSLFAVAAILPVMLVGVTSPGALRVLTRADEPETLRLWWEPQVAVVEVGEGVTLKVMAQYDDKTKLIPKAHMVIRGSPGVVVTPSEVTYTRPFGGRVVLGQVAVRAQKSGEFNVEIVEGSVDTTLADLPVVTVPAQIIVR